MKRYMLRVSFCRRLLTPLGRKSRVLLPRDIIWLLREYSVVLYGVYMM
jgi:hypothetical protein